MMWLIKRALSVIGVLILVVVIDGSVFADDGSRANAEPQVATAVAQQKRLLMENPWVCDFDLSDDEMSFAGSIYYEYHTNKTTYGKMVASMDEEIDITVSWLGTWEVPKDNELIEAVRWVSIDSVNYDQDDWDEEAIQELVKGFQAGFILEASKKLPSEILKLDHERLITDVDGTIEDCHHESLSEIRDEFGISIIP